MTTPTTLRERCLSHFDMLKISIMPEALDAALLRAEKEALPHLSFLDLVLGVQAAKRRERSIERRIRDAHFAEIKTLEAFDWDFHPPKYRAKPGSWTRLARQSGPVLRRH